MNRCNSIRQTNNRTTFPGSAWRVIAVIAFGALALNIAACSRETDNDNPHKAETPPVAESPLVKAAIQDDLAEIKSLLERFPGTESIPYYTGRS